MVLEDCTLLTTRSGAPNVSVGGTQYHSPYDPVREAQKFCAALNIEDADVIFLFGWGLGYCGSALRTRLKPGARVIVFEPNRALFELSLRQTVSRWVAQDRRFEFVVGERLGRFFDDWALHGCHETDKFLWIEWPAAVALDAPMLDSLKSSFKTRLRDKAANLLTHFQKGAMYFENALANFKYQSSADAGRLFGGFKNVPLVIVSAGPSLDLNVAELRGMSDRCFILAVDTALRPLLAAGVTPHAVLVADPSALNARHVAGAVPESVYMIAEQAVQPVALESARRRFLFGLGLFPDPLFAKFGFGKSTLEVWGSVATAALDLACRMGANPVIFAGQDFGFSWGREYARHTIFHNNPFSPEIGGPMKERDIWGNLVHTTENLIAYRDFFVRKIRQRPDIRFINATQGGILREAVEIRSLKDALALTCTKPIDAMQILSERHRIQEPSSDALKHFLQVLKSRSEDCTCLADFLELTAKQALLNKDSAAIDEKIRWGIERTELALSDC
jgi:hypothetical protein